MIFTTLCLEVSPRTTVTRVFGTLKYSANSFTSAVFAFPSVAGSRTYTRSDLSSCGSTSGPLRELGFMVTEYIITLWRSLV